MRAYVINVPESVDERLSRIRREHILSQLRDTGLDHQFVSVVDGFRLTERDRHSLVSKTVVAQYPGTQSSGIVGAALSHVQAYREILAAGDRVALVLEDDAVLPPDLSSILDQVTTNIGDSEVVLLYWRTRPGCEFSGHDAVDVGDGRKLMFPMDPHKVGCASAYVVTNQACETLVQALLPIRGCTDVWGDFHEWGAFDRIRCVVPRPVGMRNDFKSTVAYVDPHSLAGHVSTMVAHRQLFPLYQILGWRRARTERQMTSFGLVDRPSPLSDRAH